MCKPWARKCCAVLFPFPLLGRIIQVSRGFFRSQMPNLKIIISWCWDIVINKYDRDKMLFPFPPSSALCLSVEILMRVFFVLYVKPSALIIIVLIMNCLYQEPRVDDVFKFSFSICDSAVDKSLVRNKNKRYTCVYFHVGYWIERLGSVSFL